MSNIRKIKKSIKVGKWTLLNVLDYYAAIKDNLGLTQDPNKFFEEQYYKLTDPCYNEGRRIDLTHNTITEFINAYLKFLRDSEYLHHKEGKEFFARMATERKRLLDEGKSSEEVTALLQDGIAEQAYKEIHTLKTFDYEENKSQD